MPLRDGLSDPDALAQLDADEIEDRLLDCAGAQYEGMERDLTPEITREIERQVLLRVTDTAWVQHLTSMESLRQGIGLHSYGQRDPLVMYKREGHQRFQDLRDRIQRGRSPHDLPCCRQARRQGERRQGLRAAQEREPHGPGSRA